ncbi:centrosomal protein of 63 kDa isoform 2-T2 [Discoglossus pictus]
MSVMEALLKSLKQQDKMGSLQALCEAELQELMRQIDIMLAHKKSEWEAQTQIISTRLELRDQELNSALEREERLNKEVKELRKQLLEQEEGNCCKIAEYETHMKRFQEELSRLKKNYEKVQRRHMKSELKSRGEEEREVSRLTQRLEEFRQKSLDWEKQRLLYQQQVVSLEAQRRTLMEQAEIYQQQSQNRKQMIEQTSLAGRSELQHLSGQLYRANDSLCAKEQEMERLRLQVEEAAEGQNRSEQELEQARQTIQVLRDEKEELLATLQVHTDFIQNSKAQKNELHREVHRVSNALRDKENNIRSLEERLQDTRLSGSRAELEEIHSKLSTSLLNEHRLKTEVTHLEDSVGEVTIQCQQLTKELKEKRESMQLMEEEHKRCWTEMKKLKSQLSQAELSYSSALDGMRKEISQLTQELHQRDMYMASSSSASSDLERKFRSERERTERSLAEQKVSLAALESLRKENQELSEMLQKRESESLQAFDSVKDENQRLKKELSEMKSNLELLQNSQSEMQSAEERRIQELEERHEREIREMQERLKESPDFHEKEIRSLKSQQASGNLSRNSSLESLSSVIWKEGNQRSPGFGGTEDNSSAESVVERLPVPPSTPGKSIAARFLQEEEILSQELMQRLNSHIEELKQESHRTVQQFSKPR